MTKLTAEELKGYSKEDMIALVMQKHWRFQMQNSLAEKAKRWNALDR